METFSENTCFVSSLIKNYTCEAGLQCLDNYSALLSWAVCLPVQAIVRHSQKFRTTWLSTWPQAWADNTKRD